MSLSLRTKSNELYSSGTEETLEDFPPLSDTYNTISFKQAAKVSWILRLSLYAPNRMNYFGFPARFSDTYKRHFPLKKPKSEVQVTPMSLVTSAVVCRLTRTKFQSSGRFEKLVKTHTRTMGPQALLNQNKYLRFYNCSKFYNDCSFRFRCLIIEVSLRNQTKIVK